MFVALDTRRAGTPTASSTRRRAASPPQGDEAGHVLVLACRGRRATHEPRLGFGDAERAGVHEHRGDFVRRDVGPHRADDGHVVDVLAELREHFADFDAGIALLGELERRRNARPSWPGIALPSYRVSTGFGSHVSTCDGPPWAKMWMTCLALAGKCGCFGASGEREPARWPGERDP